MTRISNLRVFAYLAVLAVVGTVIWTRHAQTLAALLPWLIFLACPLIHVFMHGGHGHGHGHAGKSKTKAESEAETAAKSLADAEAEVEAATGAANDRAPSSAPGARTPDRAPRAGADHD